MNGIFFASQMFETPMLGTPMLGTPMLETPMLGTTETTRKGPEAGIVLLVGDPSPLYVYSQ